MINSAQLVAFSCAQIGISLTDDQFKPNTNAVIIIVFATCHKHFNCLYVVSPVGGLTEIQHTLCERQEPAVKVQSREQRWILE